MKVGDYVRTKKGIGKIISQNDSVRFAYPCAWETDTYLEINDDTEYVYDEDIIKSSPNIIDLIEVGDYVNGSKVVKIEEHNEELYVYVQETEYCNACDEEENIYYKENTIKSIVTKEQFESMEYKIGE